MAYKIIFIILFLLATPCLAEDKITSYTDENGRTIYTTKTINDHPNQSGKERSVIEFNDLSSTKKSFNTIENKKPADSGNVRKYPYIKQTETPNFSSNKAIEKIENAFKGFTIIMAIIVLFPFIVWLVALIDVLRNEFTGSNKMIWFLTVLLLPVLGSILYFIIADRHKIFPEDSDKAY